ncbi:unnamed protein product [Lactuca saligna]|uniref:Uncharacterized protein n=1 Tax=Lactuca saligna TaxID=75948 RepID=A0AA35V1I4_LACSI|nr:unnamed protein product [Lactuca saligna]
MSGPVEMLQLLNLFILYVIPFDNKGQLKEAFQHQVSLFKRKIEEHEHEVAQTLLDNVGKCIKKKEKKPIIEREKVRKQSLMELEMQEQVREMQEMEKTMQKLTRWITLKGKKGKKLHLSLMILSKNV